MCPWPHINGKFVSKPISIVTALHLGPNELGPYARFDKAVAYTRGGLCETFTQGPVRPSVLFFSDHPRPHPSDYTQKCQPAYSLSLYGTLPIGLHNRKNRVDCRWRPTRAAGWGWFNTDNSHASVLGQPQASALLVLFGAVGAFGDRGGTSSAR